MDFRGSTICTIVEHIQLYTSCINFSGEAWQTDVERESRQHSDKSHEDLAKYLRDFLHQKYPDVAWAVASISGKWAETNQPPVGYVLKNHYGHDIIVGRITNPDTKRNPGNLGQKLQNAYSPQYEHACVKYFIGICTKKGDRLKARETRDATWKSLFSQGLIPKLLLIVPGGNDWGVSFFSYNNLVHFKKNGDDSLALVMAEGH